MSIHTTTQTTTHIQTDDGTMYELPITDVYDNTIIEQTLIVTHNEETSYTTLRYLVNDDSSRSYFDKDDILHGWDVFFVDSQHDANQLAERLNNCDICGYNYTDHDNDEDDPADHPWENLNATKLLDGRAFLFEKYEHGQTIFALCGESSQVDRYWDVSPLAGFMVADDDWGDGSLETYARNTLAHYTSWVNGDVYGIVRVVYNELGELFDVDDVWGFIGYDNALAELGELL